MIIAPDQIDNTPAGHSLDCLIAEHVFGWLWCIPAEQAALPWGTVCRVLLPPDVNPSNWKPASGCEPLDADFGMVPEYSSKLANAWAIISRAAEKSIPVTIWFDPHTVAQQWGAVFGGRRSATGRGDTVALALSRAALKLAVDGQNADVSHV